MGVVYEDYLKGIYDTEKKEEQIEEDLTRVKEFLDKYSSALEEQEILIAEQHEMQMDDKEFEALISNLEIIKSEYVVNGALLGCTKGLSENRTVIYEGGKIESNPIRVEENSRLRINENRKETINDFIPANVEDCKGGMRDFKNGEANIISFGNCSEIKEEADLKQLLNAASLNDKEEEIVDAIKAGKGLCYCFMNLNEKWENLAMAGKYLLGTDQLPSAGINKFLNYSPYLKFNEKEGINMLSILFCPYGGGIITARESGQVESTDPDEGFYRYIKEKLDSIVKLSENFDSEVNDFKDAYNKNISVYEDLAKEIGIPPELIALIHYRENTTDYLNGTFNVYLHNGEPLGQETKKKPEKKMFNDFASAAKDALQPWQGYINKYNLDADSKDLVAMLCLSERYNGMGYFSIGKESPYIFSGTNVYVSGKFVEEPDGAGKYKSKYYPNLVDQQIGAYRLLCSILYGGK